MLVFLDYSHTNHVEFGMELANTLRQSQVSVISYWLAQNYILYVILKKKLKLIFFQIVHPVYLFILG